LSIEKVTDGAKRLGSGKMLPWVPFTLLGPAWIQLCFACAQCGLLCPFSMVFPTCFRFLVMIVSQFQTHVRLFKMIWILMRYADACDIPTYSNHFCQLFFISNIPMECCWTSPRSTRCCTTS
jgi:hypothetical protein